MINEPVALLIGSTLSIHIGVDHGNGHSPVPQVQSRSPCFYLEAESFNHSKCKVFRGFHQRVILSNSLDCVEIHPALTLGYG